MTALQTVLAALPADLDAAILVVLHLAPHHRSFLRSVLCRRSKLNVIEAVANTKLVPGTVYIANPDKHLMVQDGAIVLSDSEPVHFVRPSADVLLYSIASNYRKRSIAVVLTGCGVDGAAGTRAVKTRGGITIVQDPESSDYDGMPSAAMDAIMPDYVVALQGIAECICNCVKRSTL